MTYLLHKWWGQNNFVNVIIDIIIIIIIIIITSKYTRHSAALDILTFAN